MRQALSLALLACAASLAAAERATADTVQREPTAREKLERARQSFRAKDYPAAAPLLNDLLYPDLELVRKDEVVEVHMLLGASYFEMGNREKASAEYQKALELDLERGMTDLFFSEGAIKLFEDTREKLRERLEAERARQAIAEREKRLREYIDTIGVYETHSIGVNFIGFGFGQFQNKHRKKGVIIAFTQALAGATSVACYLYLAQKYGLSATVPIEEGPTVRRIQQIEIASGLVFFGVYAYSVIDGMLYYQPTTRVKGDDSIRDLLDGKDLIAPPRTAPPKKTSLRDRIRVAPLLSPSGVGLGLSLETD